MYEEISDQGVQLTNDVYDDKGRGFTRLTILQIQIILNKPSALYGNGGH